MNLSGVRTDILTFPGTELERRAKREGIGIVHFPNSRRFSVKEARRLAGIIENYDIVNTHISKAHWFVWLSSFFIRKRPRIVFTRRVPFRISRVSALTKYRFHTDHVIAVSREIGEALSKSGIKNVSFIPSGVELERFKPGTETKVRKELGIERDAVIIANVGNFSKVKGHHILLPAFRELLRRRGGKFYLILAGRDTKGEEARRTVKELGIEGRVKLLGFRRDIPKVLEASDLFLFTSINEGIAGSLLQAMAMEKLVVSTDVGGIKDYLKDGFNGIVIKPQVDSVVRGLERALSLGEEERRTLSRNARKTAEGFSIERTVEKTLNLYASLLKESPK